MKKTYISISVTYYTTYKTSAITHYYFNDGVNPAVSNMNKLTVAEANKKMWELVKLGGKNEYFSNQFSNTVSTRRVTFWGFL